MKKTPKPKGKRGFLRRLTRMTLRVALILVVVVAAGFTVLELGWFDGMIRNAVINRITATTGGRVELAGFHFSAFRMRADLSGLTIHGREMEGTPPLFHADSMAVSLHLDSFWSRKISLRDLRIVRPAVNLRFNPDGSSNVPGPKTPQAGSLPWNKRLFELKFRHFKLTEGTIAINAARGPLEAEGDNFGLFLNLEQSHGAPVYAGQLQWERITFAARKFLPFAAGLSMKFTIAADLFHVEQLLVKLPNSMFDLQGDVEHFVAPTVKFRSRGWLDLRDVRTVTRTPAVPGGRVDLSGEGSFRNGEWLADGRYSARDISLPYEWFHRSGISSRGTFHIARGEMNVPDFEAQALGGAMRGQVRLQFKGMQFSVESHASDMDLSALLAAVANKTFPVETFHWAGRVQVDAVTTWTENFKHLNSRGTSDWSPPAAISMGQPAEKSVPVAAHFDYDYSMNRRAVIIRASEISTPASRITIAGTIGGANSALDVGLDVRDLEPWDDFINRLRGASVAPVRITGQASWRGTLTGPLANPIFTGHTHLLQAAYGNLYWDDVEGDIKYSNSGLRFSRAHMRHGISAAQLDLALTLDDWSFKPDSQWTLDADLLRTPTVGLQEMFGWNYPVNGLLSGQFHVRGTHASPQLSALFDLEELNAWGWPVDRARGQLTLDHDQVRITNGEIRMTPLGGKMGRAPSLLTGNFAYRFADASVNFDLTGAVIPLEAIRSIQSPKLPLGGELSFQIHGSGPLLAPLAQGTIRLVDFRAGHDNLGSFEGKLIADGKHGRVDLSSAPPAATIDGFVEVAFAGNLPIHGELDVHGLDPDSVIRAGLHLEGLTGHSNVDGHFSLTGALREPDSISVDAKLSRLSFDYSGVRLENDGPIHVTYRRNEIRIDQAKLRGTDSDFQISGFARFAGDRALSLKVLGKIDLRLISGFVPRLDARGAAGINASVEGTLSVPRINGRLDVADGSANYGDFPAGLSKVSGAIVFDASRLMFENVRAEVGGGELLLSGSLTYGAGFSALRYDITTRATNVRIRYPVGMSWLTEGTLRLSGGTQSAVLSGNIIVHRLLLAADMDLGSLIVSTKDPLRAPATSSAFLRNLQFDIQARSTPDARVEWGGSSFESEADLRVRGTWENPILLGHIGLLNGDLTFAGNRYRLSRGDIDFANPFIGPVLNIQAATTVQQFEVTLDISGPLSRLSMNYRSDPPLPTSDIISLLALGRPTDANTSRGSVSGQTPGMGASALLSQAISSQLGGRIEKLFGISRFRVDPFLAGTGNEQNAAARVTIEQQVGHNLRITYVTNITGAQQEVIQVEYLVKSDVSIIALRDYNGTFGLDVVFRKRFK